MIVRGRERGTGRPVVIVGVEGGDLVAIADTFGKHGYCVGWDVNRRELHIPTGPMSGEFVSEGKFVVLAGRNFIVYDNMDSVLALYCKREVPRRVTEDDARVVDTILPSSDYYYLVDIVRALRQAEHTSMPLVYRFVYGMPDGTERDAKLIF